jgi:hypothetical protein
MMFTCTIVTALGITWAPVRFLPEGGNQEIAYKITFKLLNIICVVRP